MTVPLLPVVPNCAVITKVGVTTIVPVVTTLIVSKSPFTVLKLCVESLQVVAEAPEMVQVRDWSVVLSR